MKSIKDLLSESGSASMVRAMSALCCIVASIIALIGICKSQPDYSGISLLCTTFLTAAFGGKIMQKRIEVNNNESRHKAQNNVP